MAIHKSDPSRLLGFPSPLHRSKAFILLRQDWWAHPGHRALLPFYQRRYHFLMSFLSRDLGTGKAVTYKLPRSQFK